MIQALALVQASMYQVSMDFDYRKILKKEFERKQMVNGSFSLRSFARFIDVPAPQLSAVLAGKKGMSRIKAKAIAEKLGLNNDERDRFVALVTASHARNSTERLVAQQYIKEQKRNLPPSFKNIQEARFQVVADWYHMAILELMETEDFNGEPEFISFRLGITPMIAKNALSALERARLIEKSGPRFQKVVEFLQTDDVPSRAIRINHHQMISKALAALEEQAIEERDFSSVLVAVDSSRLPEMKRWISDFRKKFCVKAGQGPNRREVYSLNLQFVKITKNRKEIV